jgi:LCP family protein required for cell wall assembly
MIRAMPTTPSGSRQRSAFAAAFLSLVFPGLGHAYAGAFTRALGFAAAPFLILALFGGIALRASQVELLGFVIQQPVLIALFVLNAFAFVYRLVAVVDAWQVARFLNEMDGPMSSRSRISGRMALGSASAAGLLGVILVMAGGHVAVARYNAMALDLVNCVFTADSTDPSCAQPADSPSPSGTASAGATDAPDTTPQPTDAAPTPNPSAVGTVAPSLPPWNGTDRLNILLVGSDQRGNQATFNTDTMIVASIDPATGRVAMFQVPRDSVGVPVPANAQPLWGSTYAGKITSWFMNNRNRTDLWPGKTANARGFAALKAILGNLYGININYYVMVNFQGFVTSVDTLGGVQVNVQIPVADNSFPITDNTHARVYFPAGPQHMTGTAALVYARSRHGLSNDYDRGYRQQRVVLSMRESMNVRSVLANLPALIDALKTSVKTDIPTSQVPGLLALAERVDTKGVRSYVFGPPYYAVDMWGPSGGTNSNVMINAARVRQAASQAFSGDPALLAAREAIGAEEATVWVLNGSGKSGMATDSADYLSYYGMNASAPNQKAATIPATKIVVYNGAEAELQKTIAFLEKAYKVQATAATDPAVAAQVIVTLGQNAPSLAAPALGSIGPNPGIAQIADRARL